MTDAALTNAKPRRARLQFSLLSLLLLMVVAGALIGLWISQRETNRLRTENRALREELGSLTIDDPTKLYARALRVNASLKWRWRIYAPQARDYKLNVQTGGIRDSGFATGSGSSMTFAVPQGEFTLEAEVQNVDAGQPVVHVMALGARGTTGINANVSGYQDWTKGNSSEVSFTTTSTAFDPEKPLELLRLRAMKTIGPGSSSTTPAPSPGLQIWIEPLGQSTLPATTVPSGTSAGKAPSN